jgi:hypothetical protein
VTDTSLEGWFENPYGRHQARWLSRGVPTRLVRDADVEGSDPVDGQPFEVSALRRSATPGLSYGASDLRRADDVNRYSRFRGGRRPSWLMGTKAGTQSWTDGGPPSDAPLAAPRRLLQRTVFVDQSRPKTVALFLTSGIVGWSLLGAVLALAPGPWVTAAVAVATAAVVAQYVAWWQLGGSIGLLWPNALTQMARMVGLPGSFASTLVYVSMTWFAIGVAVRWHLGAPRSLPERRWVLHLGVDVLLAGALLWVVLTWAGRARDVVGQGVAGSRNRRLSRVPLRRWAGQAAMAFGTPGILLLVIARFG